MIFVSVENSADRIDSVYKENGETKEGTSSRSKEDNKSNQSSKVKDDFCVEKNQSPFYMEIGSLYLVSDPVIINDIEVDFERYFKETEPVYSANNPFNANKFSGYYNFQAVKQELNLKNGTSHNTLNETLQFKFNTMMEKRIINDSSVLFYEIVENCKKLLNDIKNKENSVFGRMIVSARRVAINQIKSVLQRYVFIHKGLTLLSPPVYNDNAEAPFTFLKHNKSLRNSNYQDYYPLYPIDVKGFRLFFKMHFDMNEDAIDVMVNLAHQTPFVWRKNNKNTDRENGIIFYDKLIYCFLFVFLEQERIELIKETLLVLGDYEFISLNEESERRLNFLNGVSCTFQDKQISKSLKSLPITNLDYSDIYIEEPGEVENRLKSVIQSMAITPSENKEGCSIVITDTEGNSHEQKLNMKIKEPSAINFSDEFINKIKVKTDQQGNIKKISFKTSERKVKLTHPDIGKDLVKTVFEPTNLINNLFFLVKDNVLKTVLFIYEEKEFIKDFNYLKQQDIIPSPFDINSLNDVKLRFDLHYFSKEQLSKYKNSISVLKYDVNLYTKKVNEIIDFFENVFGRSSIYTNDEEPTNIGEFSVFMLGITNQPYVFFKNKRNNHFPSLEYLYRKICELILNNSDPFVLSQKQQTKLQRLKRYDSDLKRERIEEESIVNEEFVFTKSRDAVPDVMTCVNYTCGKEFERTDTDLCVGHTGSWDFGHTGVSIVETLAEYDKPKSDKILWKAHWTCCGRKWEESCSAIHNHTGEYFDRSKKIDIDTNDIDFQKVFKKRVRATWINQLRKFYKYGRGQAKAVIKDFAAKTSSDYKKLDISLLPNICDALNMHLLVISNDMSFHFKLYDLINKKAFKYLATEEGYIDVGKFLKWWFCDLDELKEFSEGE